jgi:hypothetical protein
MAFAKQRVCRDGISAFGRGSGRAHLLRGVTCARYFPQELPRDEGAFPRVGLPAPVRRRNRRHRQAPTPEPPPVVASGAGGDLHHVMPTMAMCVCTMGNGRAASLLSRLIRRTDFTSTS